MIDRVELTFEYRENMEGVTIIQSVISYDENNNEIKNYQGMVGTEFFGDDAATEAIGCVAKELGVSSDIIEVESEFTETPWDD